MVITASVELAFKDNGASKMWTTAQVILVRMAPPAGMVITDTTAFVLEASLGITVKQTLTTVLATHVIMVIVSMALTHSVANAILASPVMFAKLK